MEALGFSPHPLSLLQEGCRSVPEELSLLLSPCCSTAGMVQTSLNTKAEPTASDGWRGECGTTGEVRAVSLLNELQKVMGGWLET